MRGRSPAPGDGRRPPSPVPVRSAPRASPRRPGGPFGLDSGTDPRAEPDRRDRPHDHGGGPRFRADRGHHLAPFGRVPVAGGRYIVQQNEWNSNERQCIRVSGTRWTITVADFHTATDGPPATYPSIYTGCHWGTC